MLHRNTVMQYHHTRNLDFSQVEAEIIEKCTPKRIQTQKLSASYTRLGYVKHAVRTENCGTFLEYHKTDNCYRLAKANFCKDRLCPMCTWRRSLKIFGQVSQIMDLIADDYRFVFITLTLKNCNADNLSQIIDDLQNAFKVLMRQKRMKSCIHGYFKALEITRNKQRDEYHPHYHVIMAVKPSYFHKDYMKQEELSQLWKNALQSEYTPIVDIRRIQAWEDKSIKAAVAEIAKYPFKDTQFITDDEDDTDKSVKALLKGISHRRLCSFGGVFKTAAQLLNLDDIENGNLTDESAIRNDVVTAVFKYRWTVGVGYQLF